MNERIRVLIVDDHEIVREGLRMFLSEGADGIEVVGEAIDGEQGIALAEGLRPDVVLLDLVMPGLDGIETIARMRAAGVSSGIIVLTTFADDLKVRSALEAGAIGYLLKDIVRADLVSAIRAAAAGRPTLHPEAQHQLIRQLTAPAAAPASSALDSLTPRERDVLRLIARGWSNKKIAPALDLSVGTVKGYVSSILDKLGVADRTQAAIYAVRHAMDGE